MWLNRSSVDQRRLSDALRGFVRSDNAPLKTGVHNIRVRSSGFLMQLSWQQFDQFCLSSRSAGWCWTCYLYRAGTTWTGTRSGTRASGAAGTRAGSVCSWWTYRGRGPTWWTPRSHISSSSRLRRKTTAPLSRGSRSSISSRWALRLVLWSDGVLEVQCYLHPCGCVTGEFVITGHLTGVGASATDRARVWSRLAPFDQNSLPRIASRQGH